METAQLCCVFAAGRAAGFSFKIAIIFKRFPY